MRALILLAVLELQGCVSGGTLAMIDHWPLAGQLLTASLFLWFISWLLEDFGGVAALAIILALAACSTAHAAEPSAYKSAVVRHAESFYQMPKPVLTEIWQEESSQGLDQRDHDSGTGCGDFGMRTSTASQMLGREVTCDELKSNFFRAAFLAAEYLWGEVWCGRYRTMERRILCYRTGIHSDAVSEWGNKDWRKMPKDYGTRWIMARLMHDRQSAHMVAAVERQRIFARD